MRHRWLASIISTLLLSCAVSCASTAHVRESISRPRVAASDDAPLSARKVQARAARKPRPEAARDAKTAFSATADADNAAAEHDPASEFAGVSVPDPEDASADAKAEQHAVAVRGIEGTMSEYDVRTTLEGRDKDFDACHGRRGGSGSIEFRIHILSNGEVGDVKVHRSNVRARELVDCYTDVVETSRFTAPHGGYADVRWTTKVGRSRIRKDALFERKVRWDAPSGSGATAQAESSDSSPSSSSREHRRSRRHHHH